MTTYRTLPLIFLFTFAAIRVVFARDRLDDRATYSYTPKVISELNKSIVTSVRKKLPSVHADLLLGMTIGVNEIKKDKTFYDALVQVGLIHVVVVSGYNVALIIKFFTSLFRHRFRLRDKVFVLLGTILYALVCGAQPPVIRASLMGYVSYLATTEGRGLDGLQLVLTACTLMLIFNPTYIVSLSFWLSVLATLGLIFFEPLTSSLVRALFGRSKIAEYLPIDDLSTSLACQIVVWPLISYFFGRVSVFSPIYNMLTLWLIPLCTVSGFLFIFISQALPFLSDAASILVFPFFDLFVRSVNFLSLVDHGNIGLKINFTFFALYYLSAVFVAIRVTRKKVLK